MRGVGIAWLLAPALALACAGNPDKRTLADLKKVEPDVAEMKIEDGLEQAMAGYQKFLSEAPESALTPEAMRRLADLKLEKEYGYLGEAGGVDAALPTPTAGRVTREAKNGGGAPIARNAEGDREFESRAASVDATLTGASQDQHALPGGAQVEGSGPLEAIELYDRILVSYPNYEFNDWVLYQKARAYDELGRSDEAIAVIEELITRYPTSHYIDEVQFRRAEYFFTRKRFFAAEEAYAAVTMMGPRSDYYELALYKLGWALYKQEMHEEALDQYVALLDHKVATGYDFEQTEDESDARRMVDTYRVISLSFSSLGGPETVKGYFVANGNKTYENRIYRELGEFYLEKLRYADAAGAYNAFVDLYPLHRDSPRFGMRVIEIYEVGGFPKLVLESKKDFAARYGLSSEYWLHFDIAESPDVVADLKGNLEDLATHYHAQYQDARHVEEKPENFAEALHWYRAYLASFPSEAETPAIHYQLADLMLENENFGQAAREYEQTAYGYPEHEKDSAAGYAAIFAHREHEKQTPEVGRLAIKQEAVTSTIKFVDTFPQHEHAAVVLGAAVDDLYEMKELERALAVGHRLIESFPTADVSVLRAAWAAMAHSSFDMEDYPPAEQAYAKVLEMTGPEDESRASVVDNLAAAIYKQGEQANLAKDYRTAADHFLRIAGAAPTSTIRPVAEFDASAALIALEDWSGAATVLEAFRLAHPEHELQREATKQMAYVQREQGNLSRAAEEYERVASEAETPELRSEALLVAGGLYEDAEVDDRALAVYRRYIEEFPDPLEVALETRFKVAGLHERMGDEKSRLAELKRIIRIDERAGEARTPRIRYLAARSALVLSEGLYHGFAEIQLVQPFQKNLKRKQKRMEEALASFTALLDYETAEVTAAATFYMAEIYFDFSQSLLGSERPEGLSDNEELEYELVLEEEAFPFEERAIEVHEKNLELLTTGIFNPWIEKSLGKLAEVMPGRYAKFESSAGWVDSLDQYAYQTPAALIAAAGGLPAESLAAADASIASGEAESLALEPAAESPASAAPHAESEELADVPAAPAPAPDPVEPVASETAVEGVETPATVPLAPASGSDESAGPASPAVDSEEPEAEPATLVPDPEEPAAPEDPTAAPEEPAVEPVAPTSAVEETENTESPVAGSNESDTASEPAAPDSEEPEIGPAEPASGAEEPALVPAAPAPDSDESAAPATHSPDAEGPTPPDSDEEVPAVPAEPVPDLAEEAIQSAALDLQGRQLAVR